MDEIIEELSLILLADVVPHVVDGLELELLQLTSGSLPFTRLVELVTHRRHAKDGVHHLDVFALLVDLGLVASQEFSVDLHFLYQGLDALVLLLA